MCACMFQMIDLKAILFSKANEVKNAKATGLPPARAEIRSKVLQCNTSTVMTPTCMYPTLILADCWFCPALPRRG